MRKNKILACVLTVAMVVTGVTLDGSGWSIATVEAAETGDSFMYGDFECTYLEDGTIEIKGYTGSDTKVVIPEEIEGHTVTLIGFEAFGFDQEGNDSVTDIVIPTGITNIVPGAFQYLEENSINIYFPMTDRGKELASEYIGDAQIILYENEMTNLFPLAWSSEYQTGVFYQSAQKLENANFDTVKLDIEEIVFEEEIENVPNISQEDILNAYNISAVKENGKIIESDEYIVLSRNDYDYTAYVYHLMEDHTLKYITDKYFGEEENRIIEFKADCLGNFIITKNIDYIEWVFDEETGTLTIMGRGETPSYYNGFWSEYRDKIVTVNVMEGIRTISEGTFNFYSNITRITLPESVTEIEEDAFKDCGNLESITLPEGLKTIGRSAFYGCSSLTSIEIPSTVTEIGKDAFEGCGNIASFDVALGNTSYSSVDGALYNYDKTALIIYPNTKEYVEVETTVTEIPQGAFNACENLTSVSIPQSNKWVIAESLGDYELAVPGDGSRVALYFIPEYSGCYKISFNLGEKLTSATWFSPGTYWTSLTDGGVFTTEEYLKRGTIYEMSIHADAQDENWDGVESTICNITLQDVGSGQCGENVFYMVKDGVLTISGDGDMYNYDYWNSAPWYSYKGVEEIVIEDGVKGIGNYAFSYHSNLEEIVIPDSVTAIGNGAFYSDTALERVIGGNGVTDIGKYAFSGRVPWIINAEKIKEDGIWKICLGEAFITTMDSYQLSNAEYGDEKGRNYIILPDNTIMLTGGNDEEDMSPVDSRTITIIGQGAYACYDGSGTGCGEGSSIPDCLQGSLKIPEGVEVIENAAFASQTKLEEVIMPDSLIGIGSHVFCYRQNALVVQRDACSALSSVILNDGLKWIEEEAFLDCSLTEVTIPASVMDIGDRAFGYNLESWDLGEEGFVNEYVQVDGFTIYGYTGTAAETYAEENGFTFIALDAVTLGDVDQNGTIDYFDAMAVLQYDAELIDLTEAQLLAGDVNHDGSVDSFDAVKILQYDAELIEDFE